MVYREISTREIITEDDALQYALDSINSAKTSPQEFIEWFLEWFYSGNFDKLEDEEWEMEKSYRSGI